MAPVPPPTPNDTDVPAPGSPTRRSRPPSVVATLAALLASLVVLLLIAAGTVLGPGWQGQRDRDAVLARDVQHAVQAHRMQTEFDFRGREWRAIFSPGLTTGSRAGHVQEFRDRSAAVGALAGQLQEQATDRAAVDELDAFRSDYRAMNKVYDDALTAFLASGAADPAVPQAATADRDRGPAARLAAVVDRLDAVSSATRAAQRTALAGERAVLLIVGLLAVLVVVALLRLVVRRIVRPLRALAHQADRTARHDLPVALAGLAAQPADAETPTLPPLPVDAGDEWEVLGRALSTVQGTAVALAVQQRRADRDAAQTLVNLARRNQNLAENAQECIDELNDGWRESAVVDGLARLARTTSRIRRSAESMLVLGGAATDRRIGSRPVPMSEILGAAIVEVADGARVDVHHVEEAAVTSAAVADLTHLLAELLDNATHFSPPDVRVTVVARFGSSGRYGLHVVDQGIGMTGPELTEVNARIAQAASCTRPDAHRLGLRVVGLLAARLAAQVTLQPSADRGVTALVDLPASMIVDVEHAEADRHSRTPARGAARAESVVVTAPRGVPRAAPRSPGDPPRRAAPRNAGGEVETVR